MKITNFGKAILTAVLSAGVVFGVSSCVQSYTVGFLYVTGTVTATPNGNGIISGYKIDHNTGKLNAIATLPIASGGANPVRAVLSTGSRFLYVLNRGANAAGSGDCYGSGANECQGSNISEFLVGGNGALTFVQTFYTQGLNPFRMIADPTGNFLLVLDHDVPANATAACSAALGGSATNCGDITVFAVDQTSGRLSVISNAAVTSASCPTSAFPCPLTYFPVPANPVDFVLQSTFILTLTGNTGSASDYPYAGGTQVYPYSYGSNGQLTVSQNGPNQIGITEGTAIVSAGGNIYVLDNEPTTYTNNGTTTSTNSQILPFTVGASGSLQAQTGGIVPDAPELSYPIYLIQEEKNKYIYVANQGANITGTNPQSGVVGYNIYTSPFQLNFIIGQYWWGMGSGPQCLVEDPSYQFIYTANAYDSTVTGRVVDPNSGALNDMRGPESYTLKGPATWCLVDGRTS